MVRILTSIFLMFTGWGSALAQEAESQALTSEEVARAYMAAYSDLDLDTMASFMSEDIIFIDNTNPDPSLGPDGISETGPDEIRHALEDFMEEYNPISLGFEWDWVFESNNRVVFSGWVNATYPTELDGQVYRWRARQVTIITVRDGQVIRHDDYANYEGPEEGLVDAEG